MAWNLKKIYKYSRDVFEADHMEQSCKMKLAKKD